MLVLGSLELDERVKESSYQNKHEAMVTVRKYSVSNQTIDRPSIFDRPSMTKFTPTNQNIDVCGVCGSFYFEEYK